jgi:threonine aldolase
MIERLKEDHENARYLAENLSQIKSLKLDMSKVQTNMVYIDTSNLKMNSYTFVEEMLKKGVGAAAIEPERIRFVTNKEVSKKDITKVIDIINKILKNE